MKHAFIMDPLAQVKAHKDTTYFLMLAAYQRGHQVCYLDQQALWLEHDRVCARVTWLTVNEDHRNPFTIIAQNKNQSVSASQSASEPQECDLGAMDVVWIRTDPPFNRRYFYTTLLLEHLPTRTRVLNRPSGIRNWNEKLAALHYPQLTPLTLLTNDRERIKKFSQSLSESCASHASGRITIKPVDGFGGKGIIFYDAQAARNGHGDEHGEEQSNALDAITRHGRHWVVAQQYLPAAQRGDKRILLLNGEPLGAILRVHADGTELNNLDAGGEAQPATLDSNDRTICAAVKPGLLEQGVFFAGLDIIGGLLIEVNVTSPTGLQELCRFNGAAYHHQIIAALELE